MREHFYDRLNENVEGVREKVEWMKRELMKEPARQELEDITGKLTSNKKMKTA